MRAIVKAFGLTIVNTLIVTNLWIALSPFVLIYVGTALNQLCLIANHDKFPVMANTRKVQMHREAGDLKPGEGDMIDSIHCLMSKQTRLNFLGDIFDFQDETDSPGDLMIQSGNFTEPYAIVVWMVLAAKRLREQK